jgi:hypothetical protein
MVTCDQDLCLYVMILDGPSHSRSTTLIRIRFGRELKHMMVTPLIRALAGSRAVGGGTCLWCCHNPGIKWQLMLNSRLLATSRGSDIGDHNPSLLPKVYTVLTLHRVNQCWETYRGRLKKIMGPNLTWWEWKNKRLILPPIIIKKSSPLILRALLTVHFL